MGPPATLESDPEIARRRLRQQGLSGTPFDSPGDAVGWLGAVQAQEYALSKWSVGQRVAGAEEATLDRAVADGAILRTHVLRPTWHFVRPDDIRWMLELTAPRVRSKIASYDRKLELDEAIYAASNAAIADAIEGGNHLTRKEVAAVLDDAGIPAEGQRLAHLLMRAELDGVVCSGVPRGKQQTYALLDERAPRARSLDRDEALAELTRRYFTGHGPATVVDFRWWSSLTAADAERGLELVESELERADVGDRTYWFDESTTPTEDPSPTAHLLCGYDEYVIGYTESRSVLDVAGLADMLPADESRLTHAVIIDGQLAGHWRRVASSKAVTIEVQPLRSLEPAERDALDVAVQRHGEFVGLSASWVFLGR